MRRIEAVNLLEAIPGCPNFCWWEAFVTDKAPYATRSPNPTLADTRFSPQLFADFLYRSPADQDRIAINIIAIANKLQVARDVLGFPIPIESWYRSPGLEQLVGGSGDNHPNGYAVDPALSGEKLKRFLRFFKHHSGGVGIGATQGHIDHGPKRRWPY